MYHLSHSFTMCSSCTMCLSGMENTQHMLIYLLIYQRCHFPCGYQPTSHTGLRVTCARSCCKTTALASRCRRICRTPKMFCHRLPGNQPVLAWFGFAYLICFSLILSASWHIRCVQYTCCCRLSAKSFCWATQVAQASWDFRRVWTKAILDGKMCSCLPPPPKKKKKKNMLVETRTNWHVYISMYIHQWYITKKHLNTCYNITFQDMNRSC